LVVLSTDSEFSSGDRRFRPEIRGCNRGVGVGPEPAVWNLQLHPESTEANLIVGVEVHGDAARDRKAYPLPLMPVPNSAQVRSKVEVALRIEAKHPGEIEAVAIRNVVRELAFGLGERQVSTEGEA